MIVTVNLEKAKAIAIKNLNDWAKREFLDRAADESIGISSVKIKEDGDDFATVIQNGRDAIAAATGVDQLTPIVESTEEEAKDAPLELQVSK